MSPSTRRSGSETKAHVLQVALALFTAKGYEATSLREIAEELGISKAALYYYFKSKEDIVKACLLARSEEALALLAWVEAHAAEPDVLERAVFRWIDSASVDKLRGIRFMNANPALMRSLTRFGDEIGHSLSQIASRLAGEHPTPQQCLLARLALLSLNTAVLAAEGTDCSDDDIVATAREMAQALLRQLRER